jgi:hypothetical protein
MLEGNLVWIDYQAAILHKIHHDTPLGSHLGTNKTNAALRAWYTWPHICTME